MSQDQIDVAAGNGGGALELSEHGDTALVRLCGHVDDALTRSLRDALTWAVNHHRMVVVDLSAVGAVDRFGLGALARAHDRATALGAALCLVAPPPAVRAALRAARLNDLFTVVDTCPGAAAERLPAAS
ncbi:hypothetical protein GCM10020358_60440 [Amorphoplanes nipponensis]|uniref:STAS domain-containing protein n=1 Tax=Actinoplanes nipponensis TaxID=135950 RepID=A0A919JD66_9ACTN|nr:STAS domain-containing protein [Actinoplanes nipponensis]GIE47215.1 hypothetical protein Ani05nite_07490 [Actinoplanes nipponensis]